MIWEDINVSEGKERSIDYDIEWIKLIEEAKKLGIEVEEIRKFLHDQVRSKQL